MKRSACLLMALLFLIGCGRKVIAPSAETVSVTHRPDITAFLTQSPVIEAVTPAPTCTPRPVLPTFAPNDMTEARFLEELLSQEGDPINSQVRSLLKAENVSKADFCSRLSHIIDTIDTMEKSVRDLSERGRTLTAKRKEHTIFSLMQLVSDETLDALADVYAKCPGEGDELPLRDYSASMNALLQDLQTMEDRTDPFFRLDDRAAREYMDVLCRYMGETVKPDPVFAALEGLAETGAYGIKAALQGDPEAGRKKVPISYGDFSENISFLRSVTLEICPALNEYELPTPYHVASDKDMDLMEMAFRYYPGLSYLRIYADHAPEEQRVRWKNAPIGYLKGLAVHNSYAIIPYLEDLGLDYLQYCWYEQMLTITLTGITALQIHYYGYTKKDIAEYLKSWNAEDFTDYLYEKDMVDPFDSMAAAYGYNRYLDICQAALDAGCDDEERFLQDYLAAGPAPFEALKEYMVDLYKNKVDKASDRE